MLRHIFALLTYLTRLLSRVVAVALMLPRLAWRRLDRSERAKDLAAYWPILIVAVPMAIVAACTPAERATAGAIVADVAAAAGTAVPCAIAKGVAPGIDATMCGAVSTDVSDVAKLVASILATMPAAQRMGEATGATAQIQARGRSGSLVTVTLPAGAAAYVATRMTADAGAP